MSALQETSIASFNNLLIPEIADQVALHLTPPDLLKAILVSQEWNLYFTPHLWHTIDDLTYAWPRVLGIRDREAHGTQSLQPAVEWLHPAIMKHHHHIRRLHIRSTILANAAAAVLHRDNNSGDQNKSKWKIKDISFGDMKMSSVKLEEQVWEKTAAITQVTALLLANTSTLVSLTVGYSFLPNPALEPSHPLFKALQGLHNLTSLNCGEAFRFRLSEVPEYWPRLTSLRTYSSSYNKGPDGDRLVPGLQSLVMYLPNTLRNVVQVLNTCPDLESFEITHIYDGKDEANQLATIDLVPHSNLKTMTIGWFKNAENRTPWTLFAGLPFLTTLKITDLDHDASTAIATHCPHLEVLIDTKKPKIAYAGDIVSEPSTLEPILQSCPNLRVLDTLGHRIMISSSMMTPWASIKLETLRCQIRGLSRLNRDEEIRYNRALGSLKHGRKPNVKREQIMQQHQCCVDDHTRLYTQLARQAKLRVLEVGFDHRVGCVRSPTGYTEPVKDTPELSLASGLGLLSDLKELEVFGFEGFDHRIGKEELTWMAESWPRLRMLRGLEEDTLPRIQYDEHKALLRGHLRRLRPEIEHESLGNYDVYAFWQ
ncbi:hypothetical protein BGZ96_003021 [Linnemannia gamsii]|uniref:F-box domain-containing protein n=1 Tax=Linnemannia gamsii TaxID=64522 RepID=A0ABQ7K8Q7_9FUNG|nr:hypothetical protein BGZ96_003021 [Linnemannia gamsii]